MNPSAVDEVKRREFGHDFVIGRHHDPSEITLPVRLLQRWTPQAPVLSVIIDVGNGVRKHTQFDTVRMRDPDVLSSRFAW